MTPPNIETIARAMYAADVGDDNLCVRPNWQYYIPAATLAFSMSAEICAETLAALRASDDLKIKVEVRAGNFDALRYGSSTLLDGIAAIRALAVEG